MGGIKTLFFGVTLFASLGWARPEVVFPKEVEVSNTGVISVFQVAELRGFTGRAFTELARFPLIENVEKQSEFTLTGDEISKKLRDLVRGSDELQKINPSFKIPIEVLVKIRRDGISKAEVKRAYENILQAKCNSCIYDIQVKTVPKVTSPNYEVGWTEGLGAGSFLLPVREADTSSPKWISGSIKIQKIVPVPKRLIRFGERIQLDDVDLVESNVTYLKEDSPTKEDIIGLIANKTLMPKMPILLSDLKREPAAKKGQIMRAFFGSDKFEISAQVVAEESGDVGDVIKIKNSETQKVLSAVVIDKGLVKIQ